MKTNSFIKKHPVWTGIIAFFIIFFVLPTIFGTFFLQESINNEDPGLRLVEDQEPNQPDSNPPLDSQTSSVVPNPSTSDTDIYKVTKIVDGDTLDIETGDRIRLICIDTPEVGEYYYEEASDYLERLVLGEDIELVKDISETDRYGRLLRYIYLDGDFINEKMVKQGYAKAYPYSPDTSLCPLIEDAEDYAKSHNLGIWAEQEPDQTPEDNGDSGGEAVCSCSGNIYNCDDFDTHDEAQACYEYCGSGDIHQLDRDDDGLACESLP